MDAMVQDQSTAPKVRVSEIFFFSLERVPIRGVKIFRLFFFIRPFLFAAFVVRRQIVGR